MEFDVNRRIWVWSLKTKIFVVILILSHQGRNSVCRFKSQPYYRHLAASPSFGGQIAGAKSTDTRQNGSLRNHKTKRAEICLLLFNSRLASRGLMLRTTKGIFFSPEFYCNHSGFFKKKMFWIFFLILERNSFQPNFTETIPKFKVFQKIYFFLKFFFSHPTV